jgi:hypothetical protein
MFNSQDVLTLIDDMATGNMGALCAVEQFRLLGVPLPGTHIHHDATRQKVDLAADMLRETGIKTQQGKQMTLLLYYNDRIYMHLVKQKEIANIYI